MTKLANLMQFKHMIMPCLEDWELGPFASPSLV